MNKKCFFTACDNANRDKFLPGLKNSLAKFHPDIELKVFDEEFVIGTGDPMFFYRQKPILAKMLMESGYNEVCGLDTDQIITGDLSHIWEGDYDVATVLNDPTYPIHVWDIGPDPYFNCGLVVMKSKKFVDHWLKLCMSNHIQMYQFREQDLLNILCSDYGNYNVKILDASDKIYGEFAKSLWPQAILVKDKIMINDRQLCVIHFGGGNDSQKGNLNLRFQPEIVKWLNDMKNT